MTLIDSYKRATDLQDKTVSSRLFGDSKKISSLRNGGDLTVSRLNGAFRWLSNHWPDNAVWPDDLFRPEFEKNSSVSSSAGDAGASLPPSDAPASLSQDRAVVAQLVHTQQVAGSNPAPATSFHSPDFSGSGDEGGAAFHTSAVLPDVSKSPDILPSGVNVGARRKDDAGRAPASSVLGSAV